ncbi:pyridoxal-phosphate dependent enzyme, partial [Desulfobacula sp.]
GIKSIATSLGAKKVAKAAYDWSHERKVVSHVVSDMEAVDSCLEFSNDHRILVEPACGASLAVLYNPADFLKNKNCILIIVCGGAAVTISQLELWKRELDNKANAADAKNSAADSKCI